MNQNISFSHWTNVYESLEHTISFECIIWKSNLKMALIHTYIQNGALRQKTTKKWNWKKAQNRNEK